VGNLSKLQGIIEALEMNITEIEKYEDIETAVDSIREALNEIAFKVGLDDMYLHLPCQINLCTSFSRAELGC
jgi:hypothetical protein